ncbi:RNA ligase family protein [Streptomyces sp. NPDC051561]|uniref:RNA ligase family protein n=1 Tax=Streptomyces sp. NPDC051561 TaxID=3365658 RepID=UPI0037BA2CFC
MAEIEFKAWPKTARLIREIVVTEKIDGTNAAIHVAQDDRGAYVVAAQSRKRLITPESDNYGFAKWVHENSNFLASLLGPGTHYGEWWGKGIQRGYGVPYRTFSLFNTSRWGDLMRRKAGDSYIEVVPVMYRGPFSEAEIVRALGNLHQIGSIASPFFSKPEGVCVYHTQADAIFKVTLESVMGKWAA